MFPYGMLRTGMWDIGVAVVLLWYIITHELSLLFHWKLSWGETHLLQGCCVHMLNVLQLHWHESNRNSGACVWLNCSLGCDLCQPLHGFTSQERWNVCHIQTCVGAAHYKLKVSHRRPLNACFLYWGKVDLMKRNHSTGADIQEWLCHKQWELMQILKKLRSWGQIFPYPEMSFQFHRDSDGFLLQVKLHVLLKPSAYCKAFFELEAFPGVYISPHLRGNHETKPCW